MALGFFALSENRMPCGVYFNFIVMGLFELKETYETATN